jgi:D-alanine-D-alanine ligase
MSAIRVAVIGGGENCEHDVSLASAASVRSALDPDRYDLVALTIGRDGRWTDATGASLTLAQAIDELQSCDVVFPVVHGPRGEDGSLAALLEFAGVPYVGSGVRAGALAMDKWATKLVAEAIGVRTARGELVRRGASAPTEVGMPVVVKPVAAGSSFGVTRVDDARDLASALEQAFELDDRALVEPLVTGREIDIAVLRRADGSLVLSAPLEVAVGGLFDTRRKYDGLADLRVPARITTHELADLEGQAVAMFAALGCAGVARVDFFLTADGLVLNEVNTMPGMTAASQVPRMFAAVGLEYAELLDELVVAALAPILSECRP